MGLCSVSVIRFHPFDHDSLCHKKKGHGFIPWPFSNGWGHGQPLTVCPWPVFFLSVQAVEGRPVPKAKVAKETKRTETTLHLTCHHYLFLVKELFLTLTLFQKKSILVLYDIQGIVLV
jgi:hypothetical protein